MSNPENLSKHGAPRSPAAFRFYWLCAATLLAVGMILGLAAKAQQQVDGVGRSLAAAAGMVNLAAGLGIARGGFDPGLQLDSFRLQDVFSGMGGMGELNLSAPGKRGETPLSGLVARMHPGWRNAVPRSTHEASRFDLLAARDSLATVAEGVQGTPRPPWPFKASVSYRIKASWRF